MEILSLNEPAGTPAPVVNRSTAILISILLHLLAVLIFVVAPARLPESVRVALRSWLAPLLATPAPAIPAPAVATVEPPVAKRESIPLKFAYVKVPEDVETRRNPRARLLSDRDRHARQELPTPPDARALSSDPHSEGTSPDRVRPDPRIPEGQDSPDPQARPAGSAGPASAPEAPAAAVTTRSDRSGAGTAGETTAPPDQGQRGGVAPAAPVPPSETGEDTGAPAGTVAEPSPPEGRPREAGSGAGDPARPAGPATGGIPDLRGSEYKFQYSNPGWLRDPNHGTMSFDTQGFPWGDYARRIYVAIRNRWYERIPLAAREGIRGWVCWHFIIRRDGTVSDLEMRRPSGVPPFDRAASDALHAASPLPPLPADFPNPEEGVTYCFYYNLYPGETD